MSIAFFACHLLLFELWFFFFFCTRCFKFAGAFALHSSVCNNLQNFSQAAGTLFCLSILCSPGRFIMALKEALHNTYLRIHARLLFSVRPRNSRPIFSSTSCTAFVGHCIVIENKISGERAWRGRVPPLQMCPMGTKKLLSLLNCAVKHTYVVYLLKW